MDEEIGIRSRVEVDVGTAKLGIVESITIESGTAEFVTAKSGTAKVGLSCGWELGKRTMGSSVMVGREVRSGWVEVVGGV